MKLQELYRNDPFRRQLPDHLQVRVLNALTWVLAVAWHLLWGTPPPRPYQYFGLGTPLRKLL